MMVLTSYVTITVPIEFLIFYLDKTAHNAGKLS